MLYQTKVCVNIKSLAEFAARFFCFIVLRLITSGASNREIAEKLVITEGTVKIDWAFVSQLSVRQP
jgi:FixJ family two-component response regulator